MRADYTSYMLVKKVKLCANLCEEMMEYGKFKRVYAKYVKYARLCWLGGEQGNRLWSGSILKKTSDSCFWKRVSMLPNANVIYTYIRVSIYGLEPKNIWKKLSKTIKIATWREGGQSITWMIDENDFLDAADWTDWLMGKTKRKQNWDGGVSIAGRAVGRIFGRACPHF